MKIEHTFMSSSELIAFVDYQVELTNTTCTISTLAVLLNIIKECLHGNSLK